MRDSVDHLEVPGLPQKPDNCQLLFLSRAIRQSNHYADNATASLLGRLGPVPAFRPRGKALRRHPTGAVDTDLGSGKKLGIELVERRYKSVQLTAAGREIAERAARILAEVRDLGEYARHHARLLAGRLRLGVIPTVAPYLLPPVLPMIRERFPELQLHIRETQTQTLLDELADGTLDLLLVALPLDHPDAETMPLFEDRFMLAMPSDRPIKCSVRATPELLKNDRLLLLEEGHCLRDQALSFCELRQVENIDTFGASSLSTIVQMVANGMGLTLLPELSVEVETKHGDIRLMRFAEPEPSRVVGLPGGRAAREAGLRGARQADRHGRSEQAAAAWARQSSRNDLQVATGESER